MHGIRFSGVFGKLNEATPMTVWRFNYRDKKYEVKMDDIFEHPVKAGFDVPEAWMDNVKTFSYSTYGQYGSYQGYSRAHNTPTDTTKEVTVNGKPHYNRRSGSGAHLGYVGLGSRYGNYHDDDDIIDGPLDSKKANAPKGTNETSHSGLALPSNFWGLANQPGDAADVSDDDLDDPIIQSLIAQGFQIEGVDPVGGTEESFVSNETMLQTMELLEGVRDNGRFNEIAVNHGERIAASFCAISEMSADLDQTPLLRETASDMVQMMTAEDRVNFIKDVFDALPERYKVGIQTNGL